MELAAHQKLTPGETISVQLRNLEQYGFNAIELNYPAVADCVKEVESTIADSPLRHEVCPAPPSMILPY